MSDGAAFCVDTLLPKCRYRQWTATFPWHIRYLMAKDHKLITALGRVVTKAIFAFQRKQAKRAGIPTQRAKCAALALWQRFGSALNSNCHPHVLVPDAVFVLTGGQQLEVVELPPPTDEQLGRILHKIARRSTALVHDYFGTLDDAQHLLGGAIYEAMTRLPRPAPDEDDEPEPERSGKRCAQLDGFSLHANTSVAADNRLALEKLCRYGMRPAFSHRRLSIDAAGRVLYRLRKPWPKPGGIDVLAFEPVEFLRRLAPLIPPPYANQVRYYGLFAPNAKHRDLLPAAPPSTHSLRPELHGRAAPAVNRRRSETLDGQRPAAQASVALLPNGKRPPLATLLACEPPSSATERSSAEPGPAGERPRRSRTPWAELLRRVFAVDALRCPKCMGPMVVLAFLTDLQVVDKILTHLGLPSAPAPLAPARLEQLELWDEMAEFESQSPHRAAGRDRTSRGPPMDEGDWTLELDEPIDAA
jgi:hypothetical protein